MNIIQAFKTWRLINPLIEKLKGINMTNWKTTVAAVITALPLILKALGVPLDPNLVSAIQTIAISFGFIVAKDYNVTGGTKTQ